MTSQAGLRIRNRFGVIRSRTLIPTITRSWSRTRIFLSNSDSESPIEAFYTLHSYNSCLLKCYIFFETFTETENSCCAPRFLSVASHYKIVDSQTSFMLW